MLVSRSATPTLESLLSASADAPPAQQQQRPSRHDSIVPSASSATAAALYFIAPDVFGQAELEFSRGDFAVPSDVAAAIGDVFQVQDTATCYFAIADFWMPIISRKRFFGSLMHPLSPRRCELSLLALCMELYCTALPEETDDGASELYRLTKQFHHELQAAGIMTIHLLQAEVLLATYEMGQAMFPAAYLTVGECARYGMALGLDKVMGASKGDGEQKQSWVEIEEMRRTWWAIMMLDRRVLTPYLPKMPMIIIRTATDNPSFDDYLPMDDRAFDEGATGSKNAVSISTGFSLEMGLFSRQSQATYLLGQTLKVVSAADVPPSADNLNETDDTAQLRRTLQALVNLIEKEAQVRRLELCTPSALVYTSLLLLQQHAWLKKSRSKDSEPATAELFPETESALRDLSRMAVALKQNIELNPEYSSHLSIVLLHALYQAGVLFLAMSGDSPNLSLQAKAESIKDTLRVLKPRWRLAGTYLSILEAKGHNVTSFAAQRRPIMAQLK
ncbi:Transcription factor BOA15 [Paramyrothecium foliicola]|nr:Transcription factor BOA15 [Paramyrothecium foliicola]